MTNTISANDIHAKEMAAGPEYREAYEALEAEFAAIDKSITERQRLLQTPHPAAATFSRKGRRR